MQKRPFTRVSSMLASNGFMVTALSRPNSCEKERFSASSHELSAESGDVCSILSPDCSSKRENAMCGQEIAMDSILRRTSALHAALARAFRRTGRLKNRSWHVTVVPHGPRGLAETPKFKVFPCLTVFVNVSAALRCRVTTSSRQRS